MVQELLGFDWTDRGLDAIAGRLGRDQAGASGYRLRRIIFANYWYFGYQEMVFPCGLGFLRGGNGAGKSSTIGITIPSMLDGVVRPERLDTQGGTEKKLSYYVFGNARERTAYAAMEFAWEGNFQDRVLPDGKVKPLFITVGFCLVGKSGSLTTYRFVINTDHRLGNGPGFHIPIVSAPDGTGRRKVMDAGEFRELVGSRSYGVVFDRAEDYQDAVARELFGFSSRAPLANIVKILLTLRNPDLNTRKLNHSELQALLRTALPQVSEDLPRRTADAFIFFREAKDREREINERLRACRNLRNSDLELARARARREALPVREAEMALDEKKSAISEADRQAGLAEKVLLALSSELEGMRFRRGYLVNKLAEMEVSPLARDAKEMVERLETMRREWQSARDTAAARKTTVQSHEAREKQLVEASQKLRNEWRHSGQDAKGKLGDIDTLGKQGRWTEVQEIAGHAAVALDGCHIEEEVEPALPDPGALIQPLLKLRNAQLEELDRQHRELTRTTTEEETAEGVRRQRAGELKRASAELDSEEAGLRTLWAKVSGDVARACREHPLLASVGGNAWTALVNTVESQSIGELDTVLGSLRSVLGAERKRIDQEIEDLNREIGGLQDQELTHARKLAEERERPEANPRGLGRRETARKVLGEAHIEGIPLYRLIDFAPGVSGTEQGGIERMLADSGLLDALLFRRGDEGRAQGLLAERGLADLFWDLDMAKASADSAFGRFLVVDDSVEDAAWHSVAERALRSISADVAAGQLGPAIHPENGWRHGVLRGHGGDGDAEGFIGVANRQAARERRIREIERVIGELKERVGKLAQSHEKLKAEIESVASAVRAVEAAVAEKSLDKAAYRVGHAATRKEAAQTGLREAAEHLARVGEKRRAIQAAVSASMTILGETEPNEALVRRSQDACRTIEGALGTLAYILNSMHDKWRAFQEGEESASELRSQMAQARTDLSNAERSLNDLGKKLAQVESQLTSGELGAFRKALANYKGQEESLKAEIESKRENEVRAEEILGQARRDLKKAEDERDGAESLLGSRCNDLGEFLSLNSDVLPGEDEPTLEKARRLCSVVEPSTRKELESALNEQRNKRASLFGELASGTLNEYELRLGSSRGDRISVIMAGEREATLDLLLQDLADEAANNRRLVSEREESLFREIFEERGWTEIRRAIQEADELIAKMNGVLAETPLGSDYYELKLEAHKEPSIPISNYFNLFRGEVAALPVDKRSEVKEALRRTIQLAFETSEKKPDGPSFTELLKRSFDYRVWTSLNLYMKAPGMEESTKLDSKKLKERSVGEQLFALYVPLLAAASSLYDGAASWAPRLIAIDEAWVKVSPENIQRMLGFCVKLGFQWIMASPVITGAGRTELPACADWTMFNVKGRNLAYAVPFMYQKGRAVPLDEDCLKNGRN